MPRFLVRLANWDPPDWVWPATLVAMAAIALTASLLVSPTGDPTVLTLFGDPFGGGCAFKDQTGLPCPQCGMTRSWVWTARGHLWQGMVFNPAGAALLLWIVAGGVVGAARLATRRWAKWTPPWQLLAGWLFVWLAIYGAGWGGRLFGVNPLPEQHTDLPHLRAERAAATP